MSKCGPFPGAVTGTALWIAAARARGSDRPAPVFVDPWAAALAGSDGRDRLVASEQTSGRENPFIPVRTRFFDDLLTAAAPGGPGGPLRPRRRERARTTLTPH